MNQAKDFYNPHELAKALGVSCRTLSRWANKKIGPPRVKCGHFIGYRMEAVNEWLKQNEVKGITNE